MALAADPSSPEGMRAGWHAVARVQDLIPGSRVVTRLLNEEIALQRDAEGISLKASHPAVTTAARVCERYGLVWVCLEGNAACPPSFPEYENADYRAVTCGPFGVSTSAPRVIENFLDMAHFPFVHGGLLGVQGRAKVADYRVEETPEGLLATGCRFWQPGIDTQSSAGSEVEYEYRVLGCSSAALVKRPTATDSHGIAILLAVQPALPEQSIAWIVFCTTNLGMSEVELRALQDQIFLQDKPILENQLPRLLPLGPAHEVSLRCDRLSIAYRRMLARRGARFGVIA